MAENPYLENLVKGYYHEDFDVFGDGWGPLEAFLEDNGGRSAAARLVVEIDKMIFLARNDEMRITETLLAYGIGIVPTREEETYMGWLYAVRNHAKIYSSPT